MLAETLCAGKAIHAKKGLFLFDSITGLLKVEGTQCRQIAIEWADGLLKEWCHDMVSTLVSVAGRLDI